MSPEVRNILAPIMALSGVAVLVVYIASCSGTQGAPSQPISQATPNGDTPPQAQDRPPHAAEPDDVEPDHGEPDQSKPDEREIAALEKFTQLLPEIELPEPEAASHELDGDGPSVAEVLDKGCSTTVVRGLSEQIIAECNCIQPGAYAAVPKIRNISFGKAVFPYMLTPARDALVQAAKRGKRYDMRINSMLRTVAQQYLLYDWYNRGRCGIKLAAAPGNSNHESGLAIDIASPGTWKKMLRREGFRWMGKKDRWHFDFVGNSAAIEPRKGLDIQAFQRLWNRNHPNQQLRSDGGWGPDTEKALRHAPAAGFGVGAVCRFGDGDD